MPPGKKPKPTNLKKIQGNPGKRKLNKNEPKAQNGIPDCPEWLSEVAKQAWWKFSGHLSHMNLITKADETALEMLSHAYSQWRKACDAIENNGLTYETTSIQSGKQRKVSPEVRVADAAYKQVRLMLAEFGLTPSARSRLKTGEQVQEDPMEALLNQA